MITLAAVLAAAFTQGATVLWDSGPIYQSNEDGTGFLSSLVGEAGDTFTYTAVATFYSDAGNTVVTTSTGSGPSFGAFSAETGDVFTDLNTYYAQVLVTRNDGATFQSDLTSFTLDLGMMSTGEIFFEDGYGFDDESPKFTATKWSNVPSGGVPEPTSGLLLAIGGAMLALRRRRA